MRLVAVIALLAGCGQPVEHRAAAIANDDGVAYQPAVVALRADGELFCSGTVIAPRVVVTATHCLARFASADDADLSIAIGPTAGDDAIAIVEFMKHPDWRFDGLADDIAVVALADNAPVDPLPLQRTPIGAGDQVLLMGYGITAANASDDGVQRGGPAPVQAVDGSRLLVNGGAGEPSVCPGDSGGPALFDGGDGLTVAGIHSRASCSTLSIEERVDLHTDDFIDPFVADHPPADGGCSGSRGGSGPLVVLLGLTLAATGVRRRCT